MKEDLVYWCIWAFVLYVALSVASVAISYAIRHRGAIFSSRGSVAPKYTKFVWRTLYDAKSVNIPDAGDPTYDFLKVLYRSVLALAMFAIGPLLFIAAVMDVSNLLGIRLPRRVPQGGFEADKEYPPLVVDLGVSDQGH